jgi:hypothetical protein
MIRSRWLAGFLLLLFVAPSSAGDGGWDALVSAARERVRTAQQAVVDKHRLGDFERYDIYNVEGNRLELVFSTAGKAGVVARVVHVGTLRTDTGTWRWGWADPALPKGATQAVRKVRQYGQRHGHDRLTEPEWPADRDDAGDMLAVAHHLLNGQGIYMAPDGGAISYLIITDLRAVRP